MFGMAGNIHDGEAFLERLGGGVTGTFYIAVAIIMITAIGVVNIFELVENVCRRGLSY